MHVLVGQKDRLPGREPLDLADQHFQCQLLLALRRQLGQLVALAGRNAEQRCDQRHRRDEPVRTARQKRHELVQPSLRRILALEAGGALQLLDDGVQRTGRVMGRALAEEADVGLVLEPLAQLAHQARFADPGLTREQHHLALAVARLPPAAQQQGDLLVAPHQRRQTRRLACLEATLGPAFARNPPDRKRLGKALEPLRAEVSKLEYPAHQPARRLADHDTARLGYRLQSCCQVGRLADYRLLLRRALPDQLADHDQASGDADPDREPRARRRFQSRQGINDREPRSDRPLGLVLVRLWVAEIDQHPVTHIFRDVTIPALDHFCTAILVRPDDRTHVLGIEPSREFGRAYQINQHHCELAPLGDASRRRSCLAAKRRVRPCRFFSEIRYRLQQPLAVSERRDAQLLEIVPGERAQDLTVDGVRDERLGVLLKPLLGQPPRDVKHAAPRPLLPHAPRRLAQTDPWQHSRLPDRGGNSPNAFTPATDVSQITLTLERRAPRRAIEDVGRSPLEQNRPWQPRALAIPRTGRRDRQKHAVKK